MAATKKKNEAPALTVARGETEPPRIVIYGPNGVGKTTLAADIGKGIVIDCEEGARHAPIDRYQFEQGRDRPASLEEIYGALREIVTAKHDYGVLVIDGLDELERLIWAHVCKTATPQKGDKPDEGIEGFGWSRGYKIAIGEWRRLAESLEYVRRRRSMAIVLVGHAETATIQNPIGDDYDRMSVMVHKKAAGFLCGWADIVGYLAYETAIGSKPADGAKRIAKATGARILHLRDGAAFAAKARSSHHLPATVEVSADKPWAAMRSALEGDKK